jgi:hypothetical protein
LLHHRRSPVAAAQTVRLYANEPVLVKVFVECVLTGCLANRRDCISPVVAYIAVEPRETMRHLLTGSKVLPLVFFRRTLPLHLVFRIN